MKRDVYDETMKYFIYDSSEKRLTFVASSNNKREAIKEVNAIVKRHKASDIRSRVYIEDSNKDIIYIRRSR